MMQTQGLGYNSVHGFDTGPPPPLGVDGFPQFPGWPPMQQQMFMPTQYPGFNYPTPFHPHATFPPFPFQQFPGSSLNLRNYTGGIGLPPGYDYAFPTEHCKIHVFKTGATPPWQMNISAWDPAHHVKLLVPCNTSVKELMQNLGCTNENAKKNKMHEVQEAGQGKWVKGLSISGDDKDRIKKLIKDLGWDKSRTGHPGERPVVWLYCTKD